MYIKLKNGIPETHTVGQLRRDNPNVSFPSEIPPAVLAEYGMFPVAVKEAPVVPENNRAVKNLLPTQDDQGAWVWGWTVRDKTAAEINTDLAAERASMKCSRLQGRLVLGEATCALLDAMAVDDLIPWAMRQTIKNAIEWSRMSQSMTELGYILGYTPEQMDALFRLAMTVDV